MTTKEVILFFAESCGVRYAHANRHIVGPSEAENHMSKQALQDVFELRQFSQQPANCFPALEVLESFKSNHSLTVGSLKTHFPPNITVIQITGVTR